MNIVKNEDVLLEELHKNVSKNVLSELYKVGRICLKKKPAGSLIVYASLCSLYSSGENRKIKVLNLMGLGI